MNVELSIFHDTSKEKVAQSLTFIKKCPCDDKEEMNGKKFSFFLAVFIIRANSFIV